VNTLLRKLLTVASVGATVAAFAGSAQAAKPVPLAHPVTPAPIAPLGFSDGRMIAPLGFSDGRMVVPTGFSDGRM
jgi:hypothetical protein